MQRVRIDIDPRVETNLNRLEELADALGTIVTNGAQIAKDLAPVGSAADNDDNPGQYRDSIAGRVDRGGSRVAGRIETDDPEWFYKEYGTEDTPAHATFRKTLDRLRV